MSSTINLLAAILSSIAASSHSSDLLAKSHYLAMGRCALARLKTELARAEELLEFHKAEAARRAPSQNEGEAR